ncbi:MAG TPA: hypothetical protein VLF93_07970, partial [Candidatus Saccharimonadales bacterium]|nr:hypothetical protein [Candidatus Saccharimonadales bacterium]
MARVLGEGNPFTIEGNQDLIAREFGRLMGSDNSHPVDSMRLQRRAARLGIAQEQLIPLWRSDAGSFSTHDNLYQGESGYRLHDAVLFGGDIFVSGQAVKTTDTLLVGDTVFSSRGYNPTLQVEHFRPLIELAEGIRDEHAGRIMENLRRLNPLVNRNVSAPSLYAEKNLHYGSIYEPFGKAASVFDLVYIPTLTTNNPSNITIVDSAVYGSDDLLSDVLGATIRRSVLGLRKSNPFSRPLQFSGSHLTVENSVVVGQDRIPMAVDGRITRGDPVAAKEAVTALRDLVREKGTTPLATLAA